jgi:hypothetical protein
MSRLGHMTQKPVHDLAAVLPFGQEAGGSEDLIGTTLPVPPSHLKYGHVGFVRAADRLADILRERDAEVEKHERDRTEVLLRAMSASQPNGPSSRKNKVRSSGRCERTSLSLSPDASISAHVRDTCLSEVQLYLTRARNFRTSRGLRSR